MPKRSASITVAGLALGSLLLAGAPAGAQSVYAPYVDQREAYQQHRIQEGIESGALTPGETRYLEREQRRIERAEAQMTADGNLSPRERQRLNQMQDRASRDIRRLENNNRTTEGWGGYNHNGWSGHTNSGWGGNTDDPRFERREAYQQQRIQQGINNGSLTPGEARYLEREQGRIDRAEDRMAADGNLSPRERARLNQMQNQASRDIYRMEHNNRTAAGYEGNRGWEGREYGRRDRDHDWDRREYGRQGRDRDWDGRNYGWHGNNPVSAGNGYNHGWQGNNSGSSGSTTGGTTTTGTTTTGYSNSGSGWRGHNTGGTGSTTTGTTTTTGATTGTTTAGYTKGTSGYSGGSGSTTGGTTTTGTTTAGNNQGWRGNYARNGQPGAYQQPGAQAWARPGQPAPWQGQQQYQRPPFQGAQPQMRPGQPAPWQGQQYQQARMQAPQPNFGMAPRQPSMFGGMVNRANFSAPGGGFRRR